MIPDKIYTLQTGVSLKVSTITLQELIANILSGRKCVETEQIRCPTDLFGYLSVIVTTGAADLIKRRRQWISQKNKDDLVAARPIPFREFSRFFWRSLDENDPDGDEWTRLIADEDFYHQLSLMLNQLRTAEQKMLRERNIADELNFGSV